MRAPSVRFPWRSLCQEPCPIRRRCAEWRVRSRWTYSASRAAQPGAAAHNSWASGSEGQERTSYPAPVRTVPPVVLAVDGRGGPVLLADGVGVDVIPEGLHVGVTNLRGKSGCGRTPPTERVVDDGLRERGQDALGEWLGLGEQRPRPGGQKEPP